MSNSLVLGKMKNETCGVPVKVYTFITEGHHESKKAKDINKNVVYDELKDQYYKNILFIRLYMRHEMNRIKRQDHNIGSYRIIKIYLPFYNDKKHIIKDRYESLSHFHKSIR